MNTFSKAAALSIPLAPMKVNSYVTHFLSQAILVGDFASLPSTYRCAGHGYDDGTSYYLPGWNVSSGLFETDSSRNSPFAESPSDRRSRYRSSRWNLAPGRQGTKVLQLHPPPARGGIAAISGDDPTGLEAPSGTFSRGWDIARPVGLAAGLWLYLATCGGLYS